MRINSLLASIGVVLALAASPGAYAQQLKIATVDMSSLFSKYYKTKQADATLKEMLQGLDKQSKDLVDTLKKADADYKSMVEKSNDQAISAAERDKAKQSAEKKFMELRELDQTVREFNASANAKLQEKNKLLREKLLAEIKDVVAARAKAGSYNLVIDSGSISGEGVPVILYNTGETDITGAVLDQLNAAAQALDAKPSDAKKDK